MNQSFSRRILMPIALAYIMVTCTAIYGIEHVAGITDRKLESLALFGMNIVVGLLVGPGGVSLFS